MACLLSQNWKYVDVQWLNKIKTDSAGNVHLEAPCLHPAGRQS